MGGYVLAFMVAVGALCASSAFGQFSPGELSKAHQELEGVQNCSQCHEVGKEISGKKCLVCHSEIRSAIELKRGYHFAMSYKKCMACHKEHLGKDVKTVLLDERTFDHAATGFQRTGKHASVRCGDCHARKNIASAEILKILARTNKTTYLGLSTACAGCHQDRHRGTVSTDCQSCHATTAWLPASGFDHMKTGFQLAGKHLAVQCAKCHMINLHAAKDQFLILSTKGSKDCTPCHNSPHNQKFNRQTCVSCHSAEGWRVMHTQSFDHNLTSFRLVGRHMTVQCRDCHKGPSTGSPAGTLKMAHEKCADCHLDYHKGEFLGKYDNNCLRCHTQDAFQPAVFSVEAHSQARFALSGAHAATPCVSCHPVGPDRRKSFRFVRLHCESCHKDRHAGQFASRMTETSCAACHSTNQWTLQEFDHAKTAFRLSGKHALTTCGDCHKRKRINGMEIEQFRGLLTDCESCHKEIHAGQFAVNGATNCSGCHTPQSWKQLAFDHATQSSFNLSGAHKKVRCGACHYEERTRAASFVRFKPLSSKCEACHRERKVNNG